MTELTGTATTGLVGAGGDLDVGVHIGKQHQVGIGQHDANPRRARLFHQVRIDDGDFPLEHPAGVSLGAHGHLLSGPHGADVTLGNIGHHPHHRMIGQPEQHLSGLEGLAVDGVALGDDAVLRGGPGDRIGHAPRFS